MTVMEEMEEAYFSDEAFLEADPEDIHDCPVCGRTYAGFPAMSRAGKGEICPMCGYKEAMSAFFKYKQIKH